MDIKALLNDKSTKTKEKTELLGNAVLNNHLTTEQLLDYAQTAKDTDKATCIEALEFATRQQPGIATSGLLTFAITNLAHKAPRVKWESAKVIGNIAHRFPAQLDEAIKNLLENTTHNGTVVRWSTAFALGEIIKMKTPLNTELIPAIENIAVQEEKNSIKKIYLQALKKVSW